MQVARKCGRLGKGGIPKIEAAAKVVIMDGRDGMSQSWVDPPNRGPCGYRGVKPDTAVIMTIAKRLLVSAEEFKLDGLLGED